MTPPTHIEFRLTREEAFILIGLANIGGVIIREGPPDESPKGCLTFELHNHGDISSLESYRSSIDMLGYAELLKDVDEGVERKRIPEDFDFNAGMERSFYVSRIILARLCKAAHIQMVQADKKEEG